MQSRGETVKLATRLRLEPARAGGQGAGMSPGARGTDGQASIEWLGLVALVAALLALGAGLAHAAYVGRQVTREMARALCRVGQGDCERDHDPCTLSSDRRSGRVALNLLLVRLGGGDVAVVEQRSDGTVAVTRGSTAMLGIAAGTGLSRGLALAGVDVAAAAGLSAAYVGTGEQGRTWIVASRAAAGRLVAAMRDRPVRTIRRGAPPTAIRDTAPPPDIVYHQLGTEATLDADLGATVGKDTVQLAAGSLRFDRLAGTRVDRRTGHRTIYVQASSDASLEAGGVLGLGRHGGGERYAVELDADGRPLDLQVTATGTFAGSSDLPDVVQPVAGLLATGATTGRVFQVDVHLDLTDPENLAAARGLLDAMRPHFGAPAAASQALRKRLDERGTVEARILAQADDDATHHLQLPVGPDIGGSWGHDHTTTRLLAATSRGLDGRWLQRIDCGA
jgi:hypothetical protein